MEDGKKAAVGLGIVGATGLGIWGLTKLFKKKPIIPVIYECPHCGAEFDTEAELLAHLAEYHPEEPPATLYTCPYCEEIFSSLVALDAHILSNHPETVTPLPSMPTTPEEEKAWLEWLASQKMASREKAKIAYEAGFIGEAIRYLLVVPGYSMAHYPYELRVVEAKTWDDVLQARLGALDKMASDRPYDTIFWNWYQENRMRLAQEYVQGWKTRLEAL